MKFIRFGMVVVPLLMTFAARAATFTDITQQLDAADQATRPPPKPAAVHVQVNYQLQAPGSRADALEEQKANIASSHAALYQMAARECEQLKVILDGDCRIVSITINNVSQGYNQVNPSLQVGASANFELTSHVAAPDPAGKQVPGK